MPQRTCTIDGCDRKHNARGLCITHYSRWRKHGDALADVPVTGRQPDACTVDGCDSKPEALSLCVKHYWRFKAHGTTDAPEQARGAAVSSWVGDAATYRTIHSRLTAQRGRASDHACVDCGRQAREWSYDNADPDELIDPQTGSAYSIDLDRYAPRCKRCHWEFDGGWLPPREKATTCAHGHPWDEANTAYKKTRRGGVQRDCRACARDRYHARKRAQHEADLRPVP